MSSVILTPVMALSLFIGVLAMPEQRVVLRGIARDCEMTPCIRETGMKVSAFDVKTNGRLVSILRRMDHPNGSNADSMTQFFVRYDSATKIVTRRPALSRDITNSRGRFTLRFAPVDSVLIFAYTELEDEPTHYSYQLLSGRSSKSVVLNIHRDGRR